MRPVDGFVFDLDGTVYLGERALPGAVETIAELRRRGKHTLFVSNKPLERGSMYAAKLSDLGIPTPAEQVITSAFVLGHYLSQQLPMLRYYVLGESELKKELREHGLNLVGEIVQNPLMVIDPDGIDALVVAFDRTLDYCKLNTAYQALMNGARFFATNADKVCPMPGGAIPDAGGTLAALEHMTGRRVELVAGKPSELVMQAALDRLGLQAERCMMVGDRLETDIRMGQEAGMLTAVVLTGISTRQDVMKMDQPPDFVLENLAGLLDVVH